jgi:uncharacterized membrane protein (UPF0127 family)
MERGGLLLAALLIIPLLLIGVYLAVSSSTPTGSVNANYTSFTVNGKTFALTYLATNQSERQKGLMDTKITNTTTELFVFPSSDYYPFWMYHVNSSLDIIWLSATGGSGKVVYLAEDVPGCSFLCPNYQPTAKANMVLEAKAGFARANSVALGTVISFE